MEIPVKSDIETVTKNKNTVPEMVYPESVSETVVQRTVPDVKPGNRKEQILADIAARVVQRIEQRRLKHASSEKQRKRKNVEDIKKPAKQLESACLPIGNGKHVKVCRYRHKPYVNIRDYTKTSSGELYATKRGILLQPEEWNHLKKIVKRIDQELKNM